MNTNLYFCLSQPLIKRCCIHVHQPHIFWLCVFLPQGRREWSMTGVNTNSWRTSSAWSSRKRWSDSSRNSAWPASRIWRKKPTDRNRRSCRIRSQAKWEAIYTQIIILNVTEYHDMIVVYFFFNFIYLFFLMWIYIFYYFISFLLVLVLKNEKNYTCCLANCNKIF